MVIRSQTTAASDRIHQGDKSQSSQVSDTIQQSVQSRSSRRQASGKWFSKSMILALTLLLSTLSSTQSQQITTDIKYGARRLDILDQQRDPDLDDESNVILKDIPGSEFDHGTGEGDTSAHGGIGSSSGLKQSKTEWEQRDLKKRYEEGDDRLLIQSLFPRAGPTFGGTKIEVRGDGMEDLPDIFPDPKCRFGGNANVVDGNWVKFSIRPPRFYEKEHEMAKNYTCILCEDSPANAKADIVSFSVSLTGKFNDVYSSLPYRYYEQVTVSNIYPRYGPKDGDTVVQVWGSNFYDLGDDFRCNFGTRSTKAYFVSTSFIWCRSAHSDVIQRAQPFSVSLNRQQNSKEDVEFWYYNDPNVQKLVPDFAPLSGGATITLRGNNFMPFDFVNDINNANDTFCVFGALGKKPALVKSSTEARCQSPPNNFNPPLTSVLLQLTLNNQNVTDGLEFIFFNPPGLSEVTPLRGPVTGGTVVDVFGTKFNHARDPVCIFGGITVTAKFLGPSHLSCIAPPFYKAGETTLTIKYRKDRFHAGIKIFTYYEVPTVDGIDPICGPMKGYTQIYVTGQNFLENNGFGKAQCKFNETYFTNATVIDTNTMYCDSPQLDLGDSDSGDYYYNFSVSADGESFSIPNITFQYYDDPDIRQISPANGPMNENNLVNIIGKSLNHPNMCNKKIKFGQVIMDIQSSTDTNLVVQATPVNVPGSVVVALSGNGQQYNDDPTLHFRDRSNTYEFYQPILVEDILPNIATAGGHTDIHLTGMLFDQFKNHNGTSKELDYKCRFKDGMGNTIGEERNMTKVSDIEYICTTPPSKYTGETAIEIMQNEQNWQDIGRNLTFYNGPRVTKVEPTYGVTKNPKGSYIYLDGENFACPAGDCSHIKVRFTNKNGDRIVITGHMSSGQVYATYPEYPSPETLDVDVSFNGLDWSNDKIKFSYVDPFVLGVKPRLISPKGTTKLLIEGYGMAHTTEDAQKIGFRHYPDNKMLTSAGGNAVKTYKVHNENLIEVGTYPQSNLEYNGKGIEFEPFTVSIMNPDGEYDPNDIFLYYYAEPDVKKQSAEFAYVNEEKVLLFDVDFKWGSNHPDVFRDYANFTCRFTSEKNATYQKFTDAYMETSPIGSMKHGALADQVRCRTPLWDHPGDVVRLDVSFNGHDYYGGYPMNMVDALSTLRISPLCGPIDGGTKINIYGTGMNSSVPQEAPVVVKFGTTHSQQVDKSNIEEVTYSDDDYHDELHLSDKLLKQAEMNYPDVDDKQAIEKYVGAVTPNITDMFNFAPPDVRGQGGVVSVLIGENVNISITDHERNSSTFKQKLDSFIECAYYDTSDLEFYFYRQPIITKLEPNSGLTSGGTVVDISGAWFREEPMYGLFPFCKFGNHIIRGRYISTTRIQCTSPATGESNAVKIEVSLNAVDWIDTNHDFGYYEKPILNDIRPRYGNIAGGTEIWLKGEKFSNATNGLKTVMCRFTQQNPNQPQEGEGDDTGMEEEDDFNAPIRFMPAYYVDQETMKCASPSGFGGGDKVWVDLTFNGVDFTDNKFEYNYYAFFGSFPKSAPYDATNQFIQVRGKGFNNDMAILCILDGVEMAPLAVHNNLIKCPMIVDKDKRRRLGNKENKQTHGFGENDFGSVPFAIKLEGVKQSFGNFHYYRQCVIDDVTPLVAPNDGKGAIYVIGRGFRDDFENSKLGCRIGNTLAQAQLLDSNTIRCTINNELPLIEEGESLLVTVALNTYSWAASDFSMLPYGITAMYPNQGPIGQGTNILVTGKGFDNDLRENGRCKFGTEDHYIIVEANVLDNEHLICKSPSDAFNLPEGASEQISVPFSIAFQEDLYFPFTQGGEKYRMYRQPRLLAAEPREVAVGRLSEVIVTATDEAPFFQPAPPPTGEQFEQYGIKCKFGRFGSSPATYINKTAILCLTPNIREAPSDISTEVVELTVAMNGVDYNDDFSDLSVTFKGTGQGMSIWVIIMGTLIFALLIISIIVFLFGLQTLIAAQNTKSDLDNEDNQNRPGGGNEGGQPGSASSQQRNQRSDSAAGGAGGRLSRANGGSRNTGVGSRGLTNRATGSRQGQAK